MSYRAQPENWMADLSKELDAKSPEEWLADAKKHRDDLKGLDIEIKAIEDQVAALTGRLAGFKKRREETRRLGEHAFAMIAKTIEQGK